MMKLDVFGEATCLHISVASLMISTKIADIRSGTELFQPNGYMTNSTKFCIRMVDGIPKFEGSNTYTYRIQKVREASMTRLTTLFALREISVAHQTTLLAFHGTCVRFQ